MFGTGPIEPGSGVVIARTSPGAPVPTCGPASQLPDSWLVIEGGHGPPAIGPRVPVGTLTAVVDAEPGCLECRGHAGPMTTYHFDDGYTVSVGGPEAEEILGTFTDSGRMRVLQAGPTLDASSWRTVTLDGVSLEVPPGWPAVDLAASRTPTTDASGAVTGTYALSDPGACSSAWFAGRQPPQVFTGSSGLLPSCPYSERLDLAPADGAWIRVLPFPGSALLASTVSELEVDDVTVTVGYPDPSIPVVDVIVTTPRSTIAITIGVGEDEDAAVARTILRSIATT